MPDYKYILKSFLYFIISMIIILVLTSTLNYFNLINYSTVYIISFIVKTNISYALFWSFITVCLLCNVILLLFWDTRGKTLDLKKSKAINRTFDDLTTVSLVLSSLIYLVVIFLEMIDESISHNILATTVTFILITMSYIFNRLAVYKAKEEMAKLAEKISGIK